jgi:hypothetical protein
MQKIPLLAAALLCAAFFVWTTVSDSLDWHFGQRQTDYYNLLVDGFLDGHLSLKQEVPAALLQCADPYDPAKRPVGVALHDASLYQGKYYIYYGVVPIALLLLPFRLLTGVALPVAAAVLLLVGLTYGTSLWLLAEWRRRFFPRCGPGMQFLLGLALGTASCLPLLLRRHGMYELPIASAAFCNLAALLFLTRALSETRWRVANLAASSVAWGLAIGSRPTYILAPLGLLVTAAILAKEERGARGAQPRRSRQIMLAAVLPIAVVGSLLALYNYLRFGDPTEFGVRYILSGVHETQIEHFRLRYVPINIWGYFLSAGTWSRYFPFFAPAALPAHLPYQYYAMDFPFGLLPQVPFIGLAAGLLFAARTGAAEAERRTVRRLVLVLTWTATAVIGVIVCFYAAAARYLGDMAPTLTLMAVLGTLALLERARQTGSRFKLQAAKVVVTALIALSVGGVAVASMLIYGRLRDFNPALQSRLARTANAPVHFLERLIAQPQGDLALEFGLPRENARPAPELLVATGSAGEWDRLYAICPDAQHLQLSFEHKGADPYRSDVLVVDRAARHRLRISLGPLYPPETHPFFSRGQANYARILFRTLCVELDGRVVLARRQPFYEDGRGHFMLGGNDTDPPFSGIIYSATREPLDEHALAWVRQAYDKLPTLLPDQNGSLHLKVQFTAQVPDGPREPLVVSGNTGRGDLLSVDYLGAGKLRLCLDHWGQKAEFSEAIPYQPGVTYAIEIQHPEYAARGAGGLAQAQPLRVTIDYRLVWEMPIRLYPIEPDQVYVGYNPLGGGACTAAFRGVILPGR